MVLNRKACKHAWDENQCSIAHSPYHNNQRKKSDDK